MTKRGDEAVILAILIVISALYIKDSQVDNIICDANTHAHSYTRVAT